MQPRGTMATVTGNQVTAGDLWKPLITSALDGGKPSKGVLLFSRVCAWSGELRVAAGACECRNQATCPTFSVCAVWMCHRSRMEWGCTFTCGSKKRIEVHLIFPYTVGMAACAHVPTVAGAAGRLGYGAGPAGTQHWEASPWCRPPLEGSGPFTGSLQAPWFSSCTLGLR